MSRWTHSLRKELPALLVLLALAVLVAWPNLRSTNIDDLDSAHHLMDGYFFHDVLRDHPHSPGYVFRYYKQYPALGFIFWPPLFPAVLGVFCAVFGDHVTTGRLCLLFFGVVFAFGFYALLRRQMSLWAAFCASAAAITVPGVFWSFNQIMLELPTLAVMCLALLAYLNLRDHVAAPPSTGRALITALALAAVVYAKQPAWFLYLVVLVDALLTPGLLRKRDTWITVAAFVVFVLPLAAFTVKFGHANLAQSVGSNTKLIMSNYADIPRWSFAAWSFYPRLTWTLLNPVVLLCGLGALAFAIVSREFRRANRIWLLWLVFFYLTFSFYDNRLARHATFWWPAWVALAAACIVRVAENKSRFVAVALPVLLLVPVPFQLAHAERQDYSDFHDQMPIAKTLFADAAPGNVLLFGPDKQTWIALVREQDTHRRTHILRGESLLGAGLTLPDILRKYQIGRVLVEVPSGGSTSNSADEAATPTAAALDATPGLQRLPDAHFTRRGDDVLVLQYRYTGPTDASMADIPLSNRLM